VVELEPDPDAGLPTPTGREQEILKVLWEHGPRGVGDVHRLLRTGDGKQPHFNTVQTLLRLMEAKGLVSHTEQGRSFIYEPVFSREDSAARYLDRVFDGSTSQLVLTLLKAERIPPAELEQMRKMILDARRKSAGK
jgi:BlaI family transcriptional regulator, penicillinase repressor